MASVPEIFIHLLGGTGQPQRGAVHNVPVLSDSLTDRFQASTDIGRMPRERSVLSLIGMSQCFSAQAFKEPGDIS